MLKQERIKKVNRIDFLVISSTIDFSTDLVCLELKKVQAKFYRLNRDEFNKHKIFIDISKKTMIISIEGQQYEAHFEKLKGVYFRAPVFLRTQTKSVLTVEEQLERNQWNAFLRNLIVFDKAIWMNNPVNTYRAENKLFQLRIAQKSKMAIPITYVSNFSDMNFDGDKNYVVKAIDTALFYDVENGKEMFTYSTILSGTDLLEYDLSLAPVFVQEFLHPKIDCRVTYINGRMFPVKILKNGQGITGDWRLQKNEIEYSSFQLPDELLSHIDDMMKKLGLNFGGIDLVFSKGEYYFIEVNPTGEWGWLQNQAGLKISQAIKDALYGDEKDVRGNNSNY